MSEWCVSRRSGVRRRGRARFSIGMLLLAMLVCCVLAAAGSYLAKGIQAEQSSGLLVFFLFTTAGPALLLVIVSLCRQIVIWLQRRS